MGKETSARNNIVVGLDIGTTNVTVVIGEIKSDHSLNVIGTGMHASRGIRKGVVVNIDHTVDAIRRAVHDAELMAGVHVQNVYVSVAGSHISGQNSRGVIAIKNREVSYEDIERVLESAKSVNISLDREILHVLPQEYMVDEQDSIKDPLGMSGVRLEVEVHIVTASRSSLENLRKSCTRAGLNINAMVLSQLATSYAVLAEDEKALGVAMIDIGGGTTDLAVWVEGSIWYTNTIPMGGVNVSNDIAIALKTPIDAAEKIKLQHGCATCVQEHENQIVEVPGVGGREPKRMTRYVLEQIVSPRVEEIFNWAYKQFVDTGLDEMISSGGIVVTGGSCKMDGVTALAGRVFGAETRLGLPSNIGGMVDVVNDPGYSTAVGLLLYALEENPAMVAEEQAGPVEKGQASGLDKVRRFFNEFF